MRHAKVPSHTPEATATMKFKHKQKAKTRHDVMTLCVLSAGLFLMGITGTMGRRVRPMASAARNGNKSRVSRFAQAAESTAESSATATSVSATLASMFDEKDIFVESQEKAPSPTEAPYKSSGKGKGGSSSKGKGKGGSSSKGKGSKSKSSKSTKSKGSFSSQSKCHSSAKALEKW